MPKKAEIGDIWWRASWYNSYSGQRISWAPYTVTGLTPTGLWLVRGDFRHYVGESVEGLHKTRSNNERTWRNFHTYFASPTKEEAIEHLKVRTERYVGHCRKRLLVAEDRLRALEEGKEVAVHPLKTLNLREVIKDVRKKYKEKK